MHTILIYESVLNLIFTGVTDQNFVKDTSRKRKRMRTSLAVNSSNDQVILKRMFIKLDSSKVLYRCPVIDLNYLYSGCSSYP